MPRVFFRKADPGFAKVSGIVITAMQSAMNAILPQKIVADGIYGSGTRDMVNLYQTFIGSPGTGEMDDTTWLRLMHTAEPLIFERCLQLTAHFEGTGFTQIVGNFDGAGLTWGIIGFTLSNGELGAVLNEISARHPTIFNQAFGDDADEVLQKVNLPQAQRVAWGDSISRGADKYRVAEPWRTYFNDLGVFDEVQRIQTQRAKDQYWTKIALRDAGIFGLTEELDLALLYDIAVQNGGMKSKNREKLVKDRFAASQDQSQNALRQIIEDVVVETSKVKYQADVRSRKKTVRTGTGKVHGADYRLTDWGLKAGVVPTTTNS